MTGTNRVDEWLAAQTQERKDGPVLDYHPGQRVEGRNVTSIFVGVFLFALAVGMSWRLLPAYADRSLMAHVLATLSCALALALLGWVVVSSIVSARLANWANGFVANDSNLDPVAAQERDRVRDSTLDMEFRPPFSFSRGMRDVFADASQRSIRG